MEPESRTKLERILVILTKTGSSSAQIYHSLVSLRTKWIKSKSGVECLIRSGLVGKLLPLLQRPNSKVLDITLSILGNLMLEEGPRHQVSQFGGKISPTF